MSNLKRRLLLMAAVFEGLLFGCTTGRSQELGVPPTPTNAPTTDPITTTSIEPSTAPSRVPVPTVTPAIALPTTTPAEALYPLDRLFWSPDGAYLLLDGPDTTGEFTRPLSPIWRLAADGMGELEVLVEGGYLVEVFQ